MADLGNRVWRVPPVARALGGAQGDQFPGGGFPNLLDARQHPLLTYPGEGNVVLGMPRMMLEEAEGETEGVLSVLELEILLLAARGLSNRQIATKIHITEGTVKRHLSNSYHKMEVGSRGEAVRKALHEEWITVGEITEEENEEKEA